MLDPRWRHQALVWVHGTPVTTLRSRRHEVWSLTSEHTQPPWVHGETMMHGTRKPSPIGSPSPGVPNGEVRVTNSSGVPAGSTASTNADLDLWPPATAR